MMRGRRGVGSEAVGVGGVKGRGEEGTPLWGDDKGGWRGCKGPTLPGPPLLTDPDVGITVVLIDGGQRRLLELGVVEGGARREGGVDAARDDILLLEQQGWDAAGWRRCHEQQGPRQAMQIDRQVSRWGRHRAGDRQLCSAKWNRARGGERWEPAFPALRDYQHRAGRPDLTNRAREVPFIHVLITEGHAASGCLGYLQILTRVLHLTASQALTTQGVTAVINPHIHDHDTRASHITNRWGAVPTLLLHTHEQARVAAVCGVGRDRA